MTARLAQAMMDFWFADALTGVPAATARAKVWFANDTAFDAELRRRFGALPQRAQQGALDQWASTPQLALARILALDQLPRNMYRGLAASYAFDAAALTAAVDAVGAGHDRALHPLQAVFVYLPFEHAEDLGMQARSVELIEALEARAPGGLEQLFAGFSDYARRHREVIARFGRFPHRNQVLGRASTADEERYLVEGGEHFGPRSR
jgi:uncharacterized protein (DUF924 family)